MLRSLYCLLLRLHPLPFRRAFAGEMLWIFDQAGGRRRRVGLLADCAASLARQWLVRGGGRDSLSAVQPASGAPGVPVFATVQPRNLRAVSLLQGGLLTVASFALISAFISSGAKRPPSRAAAARASAVAGSALDQSYASVVRESPSSSRPSRSFEGPAAAGSSYQYDGGAPGHRAGPTAALDLSYLFESAQPSVALEPGPLSRRHYTEYFSILRALEALDADRDLILSAEEVEAASERLQSLDANNDLRLDPEELGLHLRRDRDPGFTANAATAFMTFHIVHRTLDADRDGSISASEMHDAPSRLRSLDADGDGRITGEELLPDPIENQVALIMRMDSNWDGVIGPRERAGPYAERYRDFFAEADRDGDGLVSRAEVRSAARRRADLDGDRRLSREEVLRARRSGAFDWR